MNKILSVSIAAYNVQRYLNKTLSSFVTDEDTMDKLEVIIVSDGSTDKTVEIAKTFEKQYPNTFVVIDKQNGGYGSTINACLKIATGKYFKLVDGDDWVKTENLKKYIHSLDETDADLVVTKYCTVSDITNEQVIISSRFKYDGKLSLLSDYNLTSALQMHHTAIKTSILKDNNISITQHCYYTDIEFILKQAPYIRTVVCFDYVIYMYRIGRAQQSVSLTSLHKNIDQGIKVSLGLASFYESLKSKNDVDLYNIDYIKNSIIGSLQNKYRIMLSMPASMKPKDKMVKYDKQLHLVSKELYEMAIILHDKKYRTTIKLLRSTNFLTFRLLNFIYRLKNGLLNI